MRFLIQPEGSRFRVLDSRTGELTSGRFHRIEQAQAWVDEQHAKPVNPHRAGLHAELISSRDFYGDNERVIAN